MLSPTDPPAFHPTGSPGGIVQADSDGDGTRVALHLVVAPRPGRFQPTPADTVTTEGEVVRHGQVLGHVVGAGERREVIASCSGFLMEVMAEPEELVRAGQALAWVHPAGA